MKVSTELTAALIKQSAAAVIFHRGPLCMRVRQAAQPAVYYGLLMRHVRLSVSARGGPFCRRSNAVTIHRICS